MYRPLLMFEVLPLQSFYGLADSETEESLIDRLSFCRFVGLALTGVVPDRSAICRFQSRPRTTTASSTGR